MYMYIVLIVIAILRPTFHSHLRVHNIFGYGLHGDLFGTPPQSTCNFSVATCIIHTGSER